MCVLICIEIYEAFVELKYFLQIYTCVYFLFFLYYIFVYIYYVCLYFFKNKIRSIKNILKILRIKVSFLFNFLHFIASFSLILNFEVYTISYTYIYIYIIVQLLGTYICKGVLGL